MVDSNNIVDLKQESKAICLVRDLTSVIERTIETRDFSVAKRTTIIEEANEFLLESHGDG